MILLDSVVFHDSVTFIKMLVVGTTVVEILLKLVELVLVCVCCILGIEGTGIGLLVTGVKISNSDSMGIFPRKNFVTVGNVVVLMFGAAGIVTVLEFCCVEFWNEQSLLDRTQPSLSFQSRLIPGWLGSGALRNEQFVGIV